ncbi:hypothetical protein ACIA6C_10760 [Streptomyces sp. NPDC051578]|uniref:hypothetical protein n=1 Tax=Streptomyces sp. NPDC051578 TaxID=3365662 RepID=UPI003789CA43
MNEEQGAAPAAPDADVAPAPSARRLGRRKTVSLVAGGLAVAVLAGGGFWASVRMDEADRTAPTRYWLPNPHPSRSAPPVPEVPPNELTAKLLPVDSFHLRLGPDVDPAEGNDFYVSGDRALQTLKDSWTGLSAEQRTERDKALADLRLKGVAGRSYQRIQEEDIFEVQLTQADPKAVAAFAETSKKFLKVISDDRAAPKVEGFPGAACGLRREGFTEHKEAEKVDTIQCVAGEGDVFVTFRMYGAGQLRVAGAVEVFQKQLNHLKSPGESV